MVPQHRGMRWPLQTQASRRWRSVRGRVLVAAGALSIVAHGAVCFAGNRQEAVLCNSRLGTQLAGGRNEEATCGGLRPSKHSLKHRVALQSEPFIEAASSDWTETFSFVLDLLKVIFGASGILFIFTMFASSRQDAKSSEADALAEKARREREKLYYVAPREEPWQEAELAKFRGEEDPRGPLLLGVDGVVLNVSKARHLYGPGCEYHIFVGRDASRLLAKGKLEEEAAAEAAQPLNVAEEAQLQGWAWTLKAKYDSVGTLATAAVEAPAVESVQPNLAPGVAR